MDKIESETRDFMNVESFSQLPFIRPAPSHKEKGSAIRLFGKEFAPENEASDVSSDKDANKVVDTCNNTDSSNNRKFECHYCCRNFPTSQALGGHQNAHKRERQHAKRAHLQSSMMHGSLSSAPHVYGLMNYNRFGSGPTINPYHHSWNANSSHVYTSTGRLYNSHAAFNAHHEPINGNPLGVWRVPNAHVSTANFTRERALPMQQQQQQQVPFMFSGKESSGHQMKPLSAPISSSSHSRFGYEPKQDNVSLDLHL